MKQTMLMNQKLFVHVNGGIRLPITVQGASTRVLSLSSSDMKATRQSQQENDGTSRSQQLSSVAGGIVALGKFDALHIGHRELAIQAAKAGTPFLLSFTGMAEVLGWEPRAPVVAKCDRERVLSSWSAWCGELTPTELEVEFSKVRNLTPRQFVEKLSKELGVRGVVAGKNYRFGYRAAGDASELSRLCEEYGIEAYIINPVMDQKQSILNREFTDSKERGQVSSTRVRYALSEGDMKYVSELLGRHHRLILMLNDDQSLTSKKNTTSFPRSCLLNLPPKEGVYENCSIVYGKENVVPCRVVVDTDNIRLELVEIDCIDIPSGDPRYLNIEFGA
ncbi:putative FAD synthase [Helianthus annuus]|nr:putative FAD synthase [Helianthus annuus]